MITYRKSKESDKDGIQKVFQRCFGIRSGLLDNLEGRYFIAVDGEEIVGVTGYEYNKEFVNSRGTRGAYELDYTGVLPEYRNRDICYNLVSMMLDECVNNGIYRMYWSAWRLYGSEFANAHYVMKKLGFVPVIEPRVVWRNGYNCGIKSCEECVNYMGEKCTCFEDLWCKYLLDEFDW